MVFAKYHWRTVKVQSSGKKHNTYSFLLFSWDNTKNAKDPEEARLWQHQRLPAELVIWITNSTGAPGPFGCWWGGAGWLESPLHCVLLYCIYSTWRTEDYALIPPRLMLILRRVRDKHQARAGLQNLAKSSSSGELTDESCRAYKGKGWHHSSLPRIQVCVLDVVQQILPISRRLLRGDISDAPLSIEKGR